MERKRFIKNSLLAGAAFGLGVSCDNKSGSEGARTGLASGTTFRGTGKTLTEPAREIPILAETDVLVIGGGPAGTAAAISASRTGAETWLVERYNHLGGLWTGGLVLPLLSTHAINKKHVTKQVIHGIGGEMSQRLRELGMAIAEVNPTIDPEAGKYVLDEMIREAGVKMLYHTWAANVIMDGSKIKGVIVENKSGRMAILAKVVVDCTGDGDILSWAGEKFDVMKYNIGLNYRLGDADRINEKAAGYTKQSVGLATPIPSVNWVNVAGQFDQDGLDVINLSRLQMDCRKEIWESVQKIRKSPGHEKVFLLDTASQLGVRVSRILEAEYKLTLEDTMTYKAFDDVIGVSGAWTNVKYKGKRYDKTERPCWQIPLRSLVPKNTKNLLVAGRCFGYERDLVEDTRIIGTCLITGHGAGAAAGLAVKENQPVQKLNTAKLKKILLEQKAFLG